MLGSMLRPVGSHIPAPAGEAFDGAMPWDSRYQTELMDSGTAALSMAVGLAIEARGVSGTPEVILPAYGCPDLVAAVLFQGARPVLVDFGQEGPNLSLDGVRNAVSPDTVAVVAVDFLGLHENLESLSTLLDESGVWLIEDSAQAFPPASSTSGLADCVVLSFGRGKPINLMGGGALLVRREHSHFAAPLIEQLPRNEVSLGPVWHLKRVVFNLLLSRVFYGLLVRLSVLGLGKTEYVPLEGITRSELPWKLLNNGVNAHRHRAYLIKTYLDAFSGLDERGWLGPQRLARESKSNSNSIDFDDGKLPRLLRFPLLAPSEELRDRALDALNQAGIGANSLYGIPLPAIDGLQAQFEVTERAFPNASEFSRRLLTLPIHEDVTSDDIGRMANILGCLR